MRIAFVTTGSDNYFSKEYGVHESALASLHSLEQKTGTTIIDLTNEIRTSEDFHEASVHLKQSDLILVQCGGFTDGNLVPLFAQLDIPMCVWSVDEPTNNGDIRLHSLVTQNLFMSVLKKHCHTKTRLYTMNGAADMHDCLSDFEDIILIEKLSRKLAGGKICQIGEAAYGFLNLIENDTVNKNRFGIETVHMDVSQLVAEAESVSVSEVEKVTERILSENRSEVLSEQAMDHSVRIYLALRKIAKENNYLGLAVSCWSELQDQYAMVPCASFSWLVDYDNIPVSCEGDIGGLISMILLQELSGNKPTLLDLTRLNAEKDAILFWHCGFSPSSLANGECRLIMHPMLNRRLPDDMRMGVSQDFYFADGDVTVLRVTGNDLKLFLFEAKANQSVGEAFIGTKAWLDSFHINGKKCSANDIISTIMNEGVEHHYALVYGNIADRLRKFAALNSFEVINP